MVKTTTSISIQSDLRDKAQNILKNDGKSLSSFVEESIKNLIIKNERGLND